MPGVVGKVGVVRIGVEVEEQRILERELGNMELDKLELVVASIGELGLADT